MSTDWREKEREFLSSLEADTGRDLAGWMALISAQALKDKNEIIDWLRGQGFMFARASWLERIHNNGGRPIYIAPDDINAARPAAAPASMATVTALLAQPAMETAQSITPVMSPPPGRPSQQSPVAETQPADAARRVPVGAADATQTPAAADAVAGVLVKAKAYRPLAAHLLCALETTVAGLIVSAGSTHLTLAAPRPFALLAVSGKDIRLAFAMPGRPVEPPLEPVKLPVTLARPAEGMTHMIVLTDARQIDARLMGFAKSAATAAA